MYMPMCVRALRLCVCVGGEDALVCACACVHTCVHMCIRLYACDYVCKVYDLCTFWSHLTIMFRMEDFSTFPRRKPAAPESRYPPCLIHVPYVTGV